MGKSEKERAISNETDKLLIDLIRKKDELALSRLYDKRSRFVYSLAYNIVGDKSDAEEITEEVFFRLWEKAGSFDDSKGSVMTWLTVMTRRLAIDKTRSKQYKARNREASIETVGSGVNPGNGQSTIEQSIEISIEAGKVSQAMNQLSDEHREVINLSYYSGLSHSRIADRLDTPLGTVKTRIREAVIQLRQILGVEV